jgi:hypothetical protein
MSLPLPADIVLPLKFNDEPASTVSDVPSVNVPLSVSVEWFSVNECATAIP